MDTTRRLPDGELAVMQALWDLEPPVTSGELQQQLKESHPMALTTLLTVLTRLADKKFVKIEKEGRSSRYFPLITRESYLGGPEPAVSGPAVRRQSLRLRGGPV